VKIEKAIKTNEGKKTPSEGGGLNIGKKIPRHARDTSKIPKPKRGFGELGLLD